MSWQAQTAVNHHSRQSNLKYFRLLLYLAEGADETGLVDPAPSQDTLAAFFQVSERTIRNWLTALTESGELAQTRTGSGPGNPSAYRILLPLDPAAKVEMAERKAEETEPAGNGLAAKVENLERKVEMLTAKVEEITGFIATFQEFISTFQPEPPAQKVETNPADISTFPPKGGKGGNERWKERRQKVERPSRGGAQTIHIDPNIDPLNDDDVTHAHEATNDLLDFWQDLTGSFPPTDPGKRAVDYLGPLNRLWIRCDRDLTRAKELLRGKREQMLNQGKTPYRPAAIVPAILADLDGFQNGANGNGHYATDWRPTTDEEREWLASFMADSSGAYPH